MRSVAGVLHPHLSRRTVEFASGGLTLRGVLFSPPGPGPFPAVVATAGFACVKEMVIALELVPRLVDAGIAVLVHDHPCSGESDGSPRQHLDPIAQQDGYRDAITYLSGRPDIDAERIGVWGTSYAGGHVLGVASTDRRVRCVVSQAMTVSGHENLLRRHTPDGYVALHRQWAEERLRLSRGEAPTMVRTVAATGPSAEYYASLPPECLDRWRPEVTALTYELYDRYEPAVAMTRISPTPLLMIVIDADATTFTDTCLRTYAAALEPKRLLLLPGGHYDVYGRHDATASEAACAWFAAHLAAR